MMDALVAAALWAGVGVGLVVALAGLTGRQLFSDVRTTARVPDISRPQLLRVGGAVVAALLAWFATGWLAAPLLVGLGAWAAPRLLGGRATRDASIARTEAIAAWTEMVRDSIVAASGLEEAIAATGAIAPDPIGPEVRRLARHLDPRANMALPDALRAFAEDVDHPSADLVVTSLTLAARLEASDLGGLLSRLADAVRDDARMRIRIEVGRARTRTAAKVIAGVVAATLVLLAVVNRDYLQVYDSGIGQVVLLVVGAIFALGAWLLERMATIEMPSRFTARLVPREASWS
jgi:tight adherence protein B